MFITVKYLHCRHKCNFMVCHFQPSCSQRTSASTLPPPPVRSPLFRLPFFHTSPDICYIMSKTFTSWFWYSFCSRCSPQCVAILDRGRDATPSWWSLGLQLGQMISKFPGTSFAVPFRLFLFSGAEIYCGIFNINCKRWMQIKCLECSGKCSTMVWVEDLIRTQYMKLFHFLIKKSKHNRP